MKRRKLKASPWAKRAGVSEGAIRNFLNGDSDSLSLPVYEKLASAEGVPVAELTGQSAGQHLPSEHVLSEDPAPYESSERGPAVIQFGGEDYAAIVRFDLFASAGPGAEMPLTTEIKDRLLFRMEWIRSVTRASIEEVAALSVMGDSMEPTLKHGDTVLVDLTQNNPARDDIYVIRRDGLLVVKRLKKSFKTKTLTIISDNPKYGSEEGVDPADVLVVGRVFWMGRRI